MVGTDSAIVDLPRRAMRCAVALSVAAGVSIWLVAAALAQQACAPDTEPNDSPEQAQAVAGAFCIDGSISDTDQEILAWTVDAEASLRPWTISLSGPAGLQTRLQIHRLEEPAVDGNPAVVGPELVALVTPSGANAVSRANVFLTPGTWLVGISVSAGDGGAYQVSFASGEPAASGQAQENASAQAALPVANGFVLQGLLAKPDGWYLWQLSPAEARKRWTLSATAPLGAAVGFDLQTTDGKPLLAATRISEGQLLLPDIGLPPGSYRIHLRSEEGVPYPFSLSSVSQGPRSPGREEEPNDSALTARPVTLGQAMTGRISQPGDVDTYVLPAAAAGQLLGIGIGGDSKAITRLCVGGSDGALLQCRESVAPQLNDIVLGNSARFVTVSGAASPGATYDLTSRATGKVSPDGEAEPNDTLATANALNGASARGRMSGPDTDTYRFEVTDANLRQFTVTGDAVESIEVVNAQNQSSARADRQMDADAKLLPGPLAMTDLALQPGTYFLFVSGRAKGEYTIASNVTAPVPEAANTARESEPNDAVEQAQLLSEGERVSAQLGSPNAQYGESDYYRLSLTAAGGIALHIDPAQDCGFDVELRWDSWSAAIPRMTARQKGFVYEALLDAGEYTVRVQPAMGCDTLVIPYSIGYDAAPDLADVGDVEPNDAFNKGRRLPPGMTVSGTVGQYSDDDWFRLPALDADADVTLTATGAVEVSLTDGKATSSFQMASPTDIAVGDAGAPVSGIVPAGVSAAIRVKGSGAYTLEVRVAGQSVAASPAPQPPPGDVASGAALTATLSLADKQIAAFWHRGQRVAGSLTLANSSAAPVQAGLAPATVPAGWRIDLPAGVTVAPGETQTVPLDVEIEPDVYAARAIRLGVAVTAGDARAITVNADLAATIAAPPVGDHLSFGLPEELRGGFNVAWSALGATLLPNDKISEADYPQTINDGLGSNAGFLADAAKLPLDFTIRFGGDKAWPIRGITLNPQTPGIWPAEYIQDFELLLSADGETFTPVLKGKVGTEPREQVFLLPQATQAKAAQLRVMSNHDGNLGRMGFSEWKVIADPAAGIGVGLDIADTLRGGHIVWSQPMVSDQPPVIKGVLEAGGDGVVLRLAAGVKPQFTVGFNENRAAQIAAIEWTDAARAELARLIPGVLVEASTETALGPWVSLGEWQLQGEGRSIKAFDQPVWARFLRFTSLEAAPEDATQVQYPAGLRIEERATDAGYRSILGEWGQYSPDGFYETTLPPAAEARAESSDNNTRETAEALGMDETVSGRVEIAKDEDWYRVVQPDGLDLLAITLSGEPTVGADINLLDEAGRLVALNDAGGGARRAELEARVEPGKAYYLRVAQPPHSVVIAYDTSGSLLAFIPIIYNALQVFAAGVTPGQEAVNFLPFDRSPMLRDFSDQPAILKQALAKDSRESTTSGLEGSAITAMRELATRRGTRALLVITDAASSTITSQTDMWTMIGQERTRIFAAHTGSFDDPLREKQLLQDLALASGGHYTSSRSQAEVDVAFDRVAAWLRRPAGYSLRVAARKAVPPEPGALEIAAAVSYAGDTVAYAEPGSGSALEIVLDASGSMLKRLGGQRRIEIARNSLNRLVTQELKRGDPVALRVFGNDRPGSCETSLAQALGPLDPETTAAMVASIVPQNLAKTPIAASLRLVGDDLASASGRKTVILLTDGEETCGGDPRAEIAALAERDIEVRVNIVGFAVDDPALKGEFAEWARIGRGRYFDATKPEELDAAVKAATELPYSVSDSAGAVVASGTVGGAAIPLPAGSYRVEIASTPPQVLEGVVVQEKKTTRIEAGTS